MKQEERNEKEKQQSQDVSQRKISGTGKNLYLVCWSRCANFGYDLQRADSEKDAYDNHVFSPNKAVNYIITKISESNLPVIFKGRV